MILINIYLDIEKIEHDLEEFKDISGLEERENEKKEILCEYLINGSASFRWSFGPLSAWGSIESATTLTTHPNLYLENFNK